MMVEMAIFFDFKKVMNKVIPNELAFIMNFFVTFETK